MTVGSVVSVLAWRETVRVQDEEMLGQLILMEPETEREYVSVMRGKLAADRERAVMEGRRADERYGYVGVYASRSP